MKKLAIVLVIFGVVVTFFALDLNQYLNLDSIKLHLEGFRQWRDSAPILVSLLFFLFYVVVTALSLPGAVIMTLAAGGLFGLVWGLILVSFASTIGATLAFLVSRYLLQDLVQSRFGSRLEPINRGIEREGAFYLFSLRLVPIFPFFLINVLMGLTPIKTFTYYWVSQLGMLAGTAVYINAGTQLAALEGPSGILSPELLFSFVLLAIFPLAAKKTLEVVKRRKVYANWTRPRKFERNLVVIGAGAAGLVSAYIAAAVKAKVTLIEAHKMGGDCLNYGCVPSKALIRSARLIHQIRTGERYGLRAAEPQFSFAEVMARVQQVIAAVEPHDSAARYTGLGVEVIHGHGRIVDPWTVEVSSPGEEKRRLTTRAIVIAAGARPFVPPLPGIEDSGYLTSDTLWRELASWPAAPKRLVVLGGGPIGCELAQCFARLGSQVTQVEMVDRVLFREDVEVSELVAGALAADGVQILTGHSGVRCERDGTTRTLVVAAGGVEKRLEYDVLLCAVGRAARLTGYGLEELGIPVGRTVATNDYLQTRYPNILAAGDVAGPYQFTHTAGHQAWYAAVNALFGDWKRFRVDYRVIPWTTFTDPEVARVGLNEQEAREKDIDHQVVRFDFQDLDRAITDSATKGFVKVLTVPGKDRILGATIVGEHAGELLAEFVLAMKHGLGLGKVLSTIHTYPTLAEANRQVAGEWKRAHAPGRLLDWLKRYHRWRRG